MQARRPSRLQTPCLGRLLLPPILTNLRLLSPLLQHSRTIGISKKKHLTLPLPQSVKNAPHAPPSSSQSVLQEKITVTPSPSELQQKITVTSRRRPRTASTSLLPPRYVISRTPLQLPATVPLHCSSPTNECAIRQPLPPPALTPPSDLPPLTPPTDLPPAALPPLAAWRQWPSRRPSISPTPTPSTCAAALAPSVPGTRRLPPTVSSASVSAADTGLCRSRTLPFPPLTQRISR
jgi:hypothetical protein